MQHTRLFLAFCLLVVGGLRTLPAVADENLVTGTGNEISEYCSQANYNANNYNGTNSDWFTCVVLVHGIYSGYTFAGQLIKNIEGAAQPQDREGVRKAAYVLNTEICMPDNVTRQQAALVVTKYLTDNPAELNDSAASLVLAALEGAWPCPRTKS